MSDIIEHIDHDLTYHRLSAGCKRTLIGCKKEIQRLQNRMDFLNEQNTAQQEENQRLRDENRNLRELLAFALAGIDSVPRSWGLKITHSDHIRKNMDRFGMEPLQED